MSELVFGKYQVLRRLASGGMGDVFLACQVGIPGFERPAILKSMRQELAELPDFVDQFLDEARVAASLNHPNIVSIYEVGLWQGTYFIAMEHIHGVTVGTLIRGSLAAGRCVPPAVAACIIRDAAVGLHHAHGARNPAGAALNVIHRDISPQNIMVRGDGVTKVLDFGIAKAANRVHQTQVGRAKGKPAYMAPEQLALEAMDARADQFSLGVVLWEMCAARRLFKGETDLHTAQRILHGDIPSLQDLIPGFPPPLDAVALRMLRRPVHERYPSCGEVARDIRRFLDTLPDEAGEAQVADWVGQVCAEDLRFDFTPTAPADALVAALPGGAGDGPVPEGRPLEPTVPGGRRVAPPRPDVAPELSATEPTGTLTEPDAPPAPLLEETRPAPSPGPRPDAGGAGLDRPVRTVPRRQWMAAAVALGALCAGAWWWQSGAAPPHPVAIPAPVAVPDAPPVEPVTRPAVAPVPPVVAPPAAPLLHLDSTPRGATVALNGKDLGTTPLTLATLEPNVDQEVRLSLAGHTPQRLVVRLAAGAVEDRTVALEKTRRHVPAQAAQRKEGTPGTGGTGVVTFITEPWARIFVDGVPRGTTPLFQLSLPAGPHQVRLVNEGEHIDLTKVVVVETGTSLRLDWKLH